MQFPGSHILSISQFDRQAVDRLFEVADRMRLTRTGSESPALDALFSGPCFLNPTRTRISFGSAFNLLGGEVRETTGFESTIAKGESLFDTARVLSGYRMSLPCVTPQRVQWRNSPKAVGCRSSMAATEPTNTPPRPLIFTRSQELAGRGRSPDTLRIAMVGICVTGGPFIHCPGCCNCLAMSKSIWWLRLN